MLYQPVTFKDYYEGTPPRADCEDRYKKIKEDYGSFEGKSMIDIGCANGYFGFRFLEDGGHATYGVDVEQEYLDYINEVSEKYKQDFKCGQELPEYNFDIGLYLDLHYHDKLGDYYVNYLKKHCNVVYTSATGQAGVNNNKYFEYLETLFKNVNYIYMGFQNRIIFRCV